MFVRAIAYLFGMGAVLFLAIATAAAMYISQISADVPSYEVLADYQPPLMTRVHADDGELMAVFASERRMYLPIESIPERLKDAVIAAEDKNFYSHSGLDYYGIARAALTNIEGLISGSNNNLVGASTITQQLAKNFLLTTDQTWDRKIKEAILSLRIESAFTKDQILELYLNSNEFGNHSFGVASAALIYFNKSVDELSISECALLAALLKGPPTYNPYRYPDRALERRNYVIDRMVEDGYITAEEGDAAKAEPLGVVVQSDNRTVFSADYFRSPYADYIDTNYPDQINEYGGIPIEAADYFSEEVRRELIDMYGEEQVYTGGLSVRTSLNPQMQILARKALMDGLMRYDEAHGWRGPVDTIDISDDWGPALGAISPLSDVFEWRLAVVLSTDGSGATIGLQPGDNPDGTLSDVRETGTIPADESDWAGGGALNPGDVVYVEPLSDGTYRLHQVPEINGAIVAMDPNTGRVLAMVGGFSFGASQFNRATQAYRQPGSSFKPFVYAAALDNGYTPSSVVMDAPIEIVQEGTGEVWRPTNYSNRYYGPSTLRTGIEQSRNVMTVRLAQDMGMPLVAEYAERFGVYDNLLPVLAMALGSGETTLMRMVSGYAVLDNGGKAVTPTLIDRVQDRNGNTVYSSDTRVCPVCANQDWDGQAEPVIQDDRAQVLDPMTAYQVTSMLEGVVQRGTATSVQAVGRPVAGKTGTTNDYHDAWFVGYSPDLVVGVYIGFDNPDSLGSGQTGGVLAAPVFTDFMKVALSDSPPTPFTMPPGMQLIPIDRSTGLRVAADADGAFLEAFKPGTSPPDNFAIIGYVDALGEPLIVDPNADRAVGLGQGGLY